MKKFFFILFFGVGCEEQRQGDIPPPENPSGIAVTTGAPIGSFDPTLLTKATFGSADLSAEGLQGSSFVLLLSASENPCDNIIQGPIDHLMFILQKDLLGFSSGAQALNDLSLVEFEAPSDPALLIEGTEISSILFDSLGNNHDFTDKFSGSVVFNVNFIGDDGLPQNVAIQSTITDAGRCPFLDAIAVVGPF